MNINKNIFNIYDTNNTIIELNEQVNYGLNYINNNHLVKIPNITSALLSISGSTSNLGSVTISRGGGVGAYNKCSYLLTASGIARSDTISSLANYKCSYYIQVGSNRSYCTNGCRNSSRNVSFVLYIPPGEDDITVNFYSESTQKNNGGNLKIQLIPIL